MKIAFSILFFLFITKGVLGVDPDGVKTVIEGDSVTLQTNFTKMLKDGLIEWMVNDTNIAKIDKGTGEVKYNKLMMFNGRLTLDQTGFLTIWNIRIKHSGEYKVGSISSAGIKSNMFKVVVKESPLKSVEDKDEIKALSATKGRSETLHTETELQEHDLILWRFGAEGSLIAKVDIEENHASYYDGDDGMFRGRLEMDRKTGSLTITDLETEQTGEFRLKIISDRRIVFKRFTVTVSVPGLSAGATAGICVALLLLVAAAVTFGVVFYFRRKISEQKKLISKISDRLEQLPKISKDLEQLLKLFEQLSEISEKKESPEINEKELVKTSAKLKKMSDVCEKEFPKIYEHLEKLCKISEKLKETSEGKKPEQQLQLQEITRQEEEKDEREESIYVEGTATSLVTRRTHGESFKLNEGKNVGDDVTPAAIREGERKRLIFGEETKAFGADKILRDRQGRKSIGMVKDEDEDDEVQTHDFTDDVMISEQETCADDTQEKTPRPEIREGESEHLIYVQETPISKMLGDDKRLRDRHGRKSLAIRKTSTEDAGFQTHESTG